MYITTTCKYSPTVFLIYHAQHGAMYYVDMVPSHLQRTLPPTMSSPKAWLEHQLLPRTTHLVFPSGQTHKRLKIEGCSSNSSSSSSSTGAVTSTADRDTVRISVSPQQSMQSVIHVVAFELGMEKHKIKLRLAKEVNDGEYEEELDAPCVTSDTPDDIWHTVLREVYPAHESTFSRCAFFFEIVPDPYYPARGDFLITDARLRQWRMHTAQTSLTTESSSSSRSSKRARDGEARLSVAAGHAATTILSLPPVGTLADTIEQAHITSKLRELMGVPPRATEQLYLPPASEEVHKEVRFNSAYGTGSDVIKYRDLTYSEGASTRVISPAYPLIITIIRDDKVHEALSKWSRVANLSNFTDPASAGLVLSNILSYRVAVVLVLLLTEPFFFYLELGF